MVKFLIALLIIFGGNSSVKTEYEVLMNVSAFCKKECCCGRWANEITASNHVIQPGDKFVAASADLPFHTIVDVPGYGRVLVLDRGGAITDGKLDVFFGDKDGVSGHQRALNWGRQYLVCKIEFQKQKQNSKQGLF